MAEGEKKNILATIMLLVILAIGVLSVVNFRSAMKGINNWYLYNKYPMKYDYEIVYFSGKYNLEPSLVSAVVYEESKFNPEAVSDKGAMGLMQMIPETIKYVRQQVDPPTRSAISFDITDQINYGCFYLSYLFNKYENTEWALAAYNAGEGNVDKWLEDGELNIEFEETRNFVERVKNSQDKYKELYFNK